MSYLSNLDQKNMDEKTLLQHLSGWKAKGFRIGFTNGCFDLLHKGHVSYLSQAADLCSILIVGVNSDASVKTLNKGDDRPVNNEDTRAYLISALHCVKAVTIFHEPTPYELIKLIQPDVLIKGGDYDVDETNTSSKKYIVGTDIVKSKGGSVQVIPFVEGFSTTQLIEKLKN